MATFDVSQLATTYIDQLTAGSCPTGKNRYPDAAPAAAALELARRRRCTEPWRRERRSYFCPLCRGIHLTSKELGLPAKENTR
jgi:hypothetical protein